MTSGVGERAVRGSLWLFGVNLVSKSSQVAVTLVLATFLTEDGLGVVALVVSLVNIGQIAGSMGVYDVISRTDRDPLRLARTVLTLSVGVGVALAITLVLAADLIAAALGAPDAAPLMRLAAISLPFSAAGGVQMGLVHRDLDFRRRLLPDAGSMVLGATVTVVLASRGAGPSAVVIGLLCTAIAQPVLGAFVGVRLLPGWDRDAAREALGWMSVVGPGALVAILLVNADYLAIGHVLGSGAVGVYSLAYRIAWVPYILVAVVLGGVMFPVCAELVRSGRRDDLPGTLRRFTQAALVITGGLYVVVALLADRVVLLDERWAPTAGPLLLLCCYGLGITLLHTWYQVIKAAGHARVYLALEVTHLVALVTALALTTRHGLLAVALTQVAVAWLLVPLTWWVLTRHGLAFPVAELARQAAGVATAGAAAFALHVVLGPLPGVPGALVEGAVLALAYCAVALLTNRGALREMRRDLA